jgi:hypothetical protein
LHIRPKDACRIAVLCKSPFRFFNYPNFVDDSTYLFLQSFNVRSGRCKTESEPPERSSPTASKPLDGILAMLYLPNIKYSRNFSFGKNP